MFNAIKEINFIKSKMDTFMLALDFNLACEIENSRDGGFVSYYNKKKNISIHVYFLPNYDVTIQYGDTILDFFRFLFFRKKANKFISIKNHMSLKNVTDFDGFLDKSKVLINDVLNKKQA